MFCASRLIFGGNEVVGSRFHVLRARTHVRRYRGRRVPFSCFPRSHSFSAVTRASGPVLMFCAPELIFGGSEGDESRFLFCAPGLIFDGIEGDESRFHVLRARIRFRPYRGHLVPFSCFARPDSFPRVTRPSGPVFKFCPPGLMFYGKEGVGSRFHVLRDRTHFRRYRGNRVTD
jgi:hypothetical protein